MGGRGGGRRGGGRSESGKERRKWDKNRRREWKWKWKWKRKRDIETFEEREREDGVSQVENRVALWGVMENERQGDDLMNGGGGGWGNTVNGKAVFWTRWWC